MSSGTVCICEQKRGINYLFPVEPVGESAGKGMMQPEEARRTAFLEFNNNVVHSYHYVSQFTAVHKGQCRATSSCQCGGL